MAAIDKQIYDKLKALGISDTLAKIITGQAYYESKGQTTENYKQGYNIMNMSYWGQSGSSQGLPYQADGETRYFAKFVSLDAALTAWVNALKSFQSAGLFKIADLTTPALYCAALKKAGLVKSDIAAYQKGIEAGTVDAFKDYTIYYIIGAVAAAFLLLRKKH